MSPDTRNCQTDRGFTGKADFLGKNLQAAPELSKSQVPSACRHRTISEDNRA